MAGPKLLALDFEWWNSAARDSVYQIGWAANWIQTERSRCIDVRPPRDDAMEIYASRKDHISRTRNAPSFAEVYRTRLLPLLKSADYIVAHAAHNDRYVLRHCCQAFELEMPDLEWIDTMMVARHILDYGKKASLKRIAGKLERELGHDLNHRPHDAGSDAAVTLDILEHAVARRGWDAIEELTRTGRAERLASAETPRTRQAVPTTPVEESASDRETAVWNAVAKQLDDEWLFEAGGPGTEDEAALPPRKQLVAMWVASYEGNLAAMLQDQMREDLRLACASLGLEDEGYSKKLSARLAAFARDAAPPLPKSRVSQKQDASKLRRALAELMTRAHLKDAVAMMQEPPAGYSRSTRADLEKIFVTAWDGDLEELLGDFYVADLKHAFEALDLDRPRLRNEMIADLVARFG